jgi:hypothetical protein
LTELKVLLIPTIGSGMPDSAYKVSRRIQAHINDIFELHTSCSRCLPYEPSGWFGGRFDPERWRSEMEKPVYEEDEEVHHTHRQRWEDLAAEWDIIEATISRTGSQAFGALLVYVGGFHLRYV